MLAALGRVGGLGRAARRGGRRFVATVDEIAPGRVFFGIGSRDSAIVNLAERPSTLADLRAYIETVGALHTKGETTLRDRMVRLTWAKRAIPIYLSAEGSRSKASTSHPRWPMPSSDRRRKPHASYSVYKAKTAEREILHQAALRKAATREEVELLNETLRRDLERLASDRGRKIAEIRGEVFP